MELEDWQYPPLPLPEDSWVEEDDQEDWYSDTYACGCCNCCGCMCDWDDDFWNDEEDED